MRVVKTQAQLDAALKAGDDWIEIRSEPGVWLEVRATGSSTVTATGSSTVRATGSSTVRATGSSTVTAYDSSTVTAYDSSTVRATGSSTVRATGSSTVTAYDSSTVTAYDSSTVTATPRVAVHLHRSTVHVSGGTVIDHTDLREMDAAAWCEYHGVDVQKGVATLYKAVNDAWTTSRGFDYSPGATPSAPDWLDNTECGGGLHFSPTPTQALAYFDGATRFVAVGVQVADLRQIPGGVAKAKAPRVVRACVAVDIDGNEVPA